MRLSPKRLRGVFSPFSRLAHYVLSVFGIPFARTPAFLVAAVAPLVVAAVLLSHGK